MVIILSGCAANPNKLYQEIDSSTSVIPHGSIDVITKQNTIELPTTIHGVSFSRDTFHITHEDPIIDFGSYKSNYKLFSFSLSEGDHFQVSITSICDCFGFNKMILVPNAYVIDSSGNTIDTSLVNGGATLSTVGYILDGVATKNDNYYLVYAANNSKPGSSVAVEQAKMSGYVPTGIYVSNSSNPYGKIMPSYEVISK